MNATPTIVADRLTKSWDSRRGIVDVTFAVEPGEIFGFLGPNGAGKTTTIRTLMGFVRPTAGRARIFGLDCWRDAPRIHERVGFVPGDVSLYTGLNAGEHLLLLARMRGLEKPSRLVELAERFDLDLRTPVRALSRGNRQKVALIAALLHEPPLLILDEPTSGLDPIVQRQFLDLLRDERERGRTIFLSSHLLHEVDRVCTRVAIIREGRLVAVDTIAALRARSPRRLSVTFSAEPPPAALALDGASVVTRAGRQVVYSVSGEPGPVLCALAAWGIEELSYGPPELEDVFQRYYRT